MACPLEPEPLISLGDKLDKINHSYQFLRVAAVNPGNLLGRKLVTPVEVCKP